jgi:hypothetical protein
MQRSLFPVSISTNGGISLTWCKTRPHIIGTEPRYFGVGWMGGTLRCIHAVHGRGIILQRYNETMTQHRASMQHETFTSSAAANACMLALPSIIEVLQCCSGI